MIDIIIGTVLLCFVLGFGFAVLAVESMHKECAALRARVAELEADLWRVRDAYNELIMAVGMKFPDESRHQTALRYIRQREAGGSAQCAAGAALAGQK